MTGQEELHENTTYIDNIQGTDVQIVATHEEILRLGGFEWHLHLLVDGVSCGKIPGIETENDVQELIDAISSTQCESYSTIEQWFFCTALQHLRESTES